MRIPRIPLLALWLAFAVVARGEAPFLDLSFPAACKKAEAEKKIVVIDFYTTWCMPCKMMDQTTWSDASVRKWIDENAVAMKVDAEKSREFAARFKVRGFPTVIFVKPDGSVIDRFLGMRRPAGFLEAAEGARTGKDAITRAREKLEAGGKNDPMERERFADLLVEKERYVEALEHYLWCFDHGLENSVGYTGVRLSFLLSDIKQLGQVYPPALEALRQRRNRAEKRIVRYLDDKPVKRKGRKGLLGFFQRLTTTHVESTLNDVSEFSSINDYLEDDEDTIRFYDKITDRGDERAQTVRRFLMTDLFEPLVHARRYDDLMRDVDPVQKLTDDISIMRIGKMFSGHDEHEEMLRKFERERIIKSGGRCYEVCIGAGRPEVAEQVKGMLLEYEASAETFEALLWHADRAGSADAVRALRDEALNKLKGDEAEAVRKKAESLLADSGGSKE